MCAYVEAMRHRRADLCRRSDNMVYLGIFSWYEINLFWKPYQLASGYPVRHIPRRSRSNWIFRAIGQNFLPMAHLSQGYEDRRLKPFNSPVS